LACDTSLSNYREVWVKLARKLGALMCSDIIDVLIFSSTTIHRIVVSEIRLRRHKQGIILEQKRIGGGVHTLTDAVPPNKKK
jgi:hypothetical protein